MLDIFVYLAYANILQRRAPLSIKLINTINTRSIYKRLRDAKRCIEMVVCLYNVDEKW